MNPIPPETRAAVTAQLAATHNITQTSARAMVDDVCERWRDSPFAHDVELVVMAMLRPLVDAIASGEAVAGVKTTDLRASTADDVLAGGQA
jgi:hypothetical protein